MTAASKPIPNPVPTRMDVVRATKEANAPAGTIPPAAMAMIAERKARAKIAQAIRGTIWGKDFDHNAAMAVAAYCARNNIDAVRHLDVLGGRLYLNANYYQEAGAQLIAAGKIKSIVPDHIEHDPRLDEAYLEGVKFATEAREAGQDVEAQFWTEQANAARREIARRRNLRIRYGAKEKAAAVVVITITPVDLDEPIVGWNECGGGIRKGDPVGDDRPMLTAETRAARRAWKQLITVIPSIAPKVAAAEEEGAAVEEIIAEGARLAAGEDESETRSQQIETITVEERRTQPVTPSEADDLAFDQELLDKEAGKKPSTSGSVTMPKGGKIADAFPPREPKLAPSERGKPPIDQTDIPI